MSLKKACLIVKATNSRVRSLRLPTLVGWLLLTIKLQIFDDRGVNEIYFRQQVVMLFLFSILIPVVGIESGPRS